MSKDKNKKRGRPVGKFSKVFDIHLRLSYVDKSKLDFIREQTGKSGPQILREALDMVYNKAYNEFFDAGF